jgi:hypothetical protein
MGEPGHAGTGEAARSPCCSNDWVLGPGPLNLACLQAGAPPTPTTPACTQDSKDFVFLLSTRAGGLGINLATADTVRADCLLDGQPGPWMTPAGPCLSPWVQPYPGGLGLGLGLGLITPLTLFEPLGSALSRQPRARIQPGSGFQGFRALRARGETRSPCPAGRSDACTPDCKLAACITPAQRPDRVLSAHTGHHLRLRLEPPE